MSGGKLDGVPCLSFTLALLSWPPSPIVQGAGNFHFAPGRSYQQGNMHIHDLSPFAGQASSPRPRLLAPLRTAPPRAACPAVQRQPALRVHPALLRGAWILPGTLSAVVAVNCPAQHLGPSLQTFDFSHTIHKLAFGQEFPGMKNPLDGVHVEQHLAQPDNSGEGQGWS